MTNHNALPAEADPRQQELANRLISAATMLNEAMNGPMDPDGPHTMYLDISGSGLPPTAEVDAGRVSWRVLSVSVSKDGTFAATFGDPESRVEALDDYGSNQIVHTNALTITAYPEDKKDMQGNPMNGLFMQGFSKNGKQNFNPGDTVRTLNGNLFDPTRLVKGFAGNLEKTAKEQRDLSIERAEREARDRDAVEGIVLRAVNRVNVRTHEDTDPRSQQSAFKLDREPYEDNGATRVLAVDLWKHPGKSQTVVFPSSEESYTGPYYLEAGGQTFRIEPEKAVPGVWVLTNLNYEQRMIREIEGAFSVGPEWEKALMDNPKLRSHMKWLEEQQIQKARANLVQGAGPVGIGKSGNRPVPIIDGDVAMEKNHCIITITPHGELVITNGLDRSGKPAITRVLYSQEDTLGQEGNARIAREIGEIQGKYMVLDSNQKFDQLHPRGLAARIRSARNTKKTAPLR